VNEIPLTHALVADDEPHIGRIIKMKLEQGPFRVTLVYDGREALEVLRREDDIKLVLLDLMMPYLSGLDVLAEMKRDERLKHLPAIVLTAAGQEQQHHLALELGAAEFMTKPFSPKRLYARAAELAGIAPDESAAESALPSGPSSWPWASGRASGQSAHPIDPSSFCRSRRANRCSRTRWRASRRWFRWSTRSYSRTKGS